MIIELEGDNSKQILKNLSSWTLDDNSGTTADRATLVVHDLDVLPKSGTEYKIKVNGELRGKFQVSAVTEQLIPPQITIQLTPAIFNVKDKTGWREKRRKTFPPATVFDVVTSVMKPHGYKIRIDKDLSGIKTEHLNQTEETDKHFISRLAKRYDAIAKPINGFFVFGKKGNIKTLSGGKKNAVKVSKASLLYGQNSISYPSAIRFKGVKAAWRVTETGAHGNIEIGSAPFDRLREPFQSAAQATERAEARLIEVIRQGQQFNATVDGTAGLFAEAVLTIEGFQNKRIIGDWSIDEVSLSGNRTTYTARIKATRPK